MTASRPVVAGDVMAGVEESHLFQLLEGGIAYLDIRVLGASRDMIHSPERSVCRCDRVAAFFQKIGIACTNDPSDRKHTADKNGSVFQESWLAHPNHDLDLRPQSICGLSFP